MTTGAQLRVLLAPLAGLHPATFNRYLNNLADNGLVRRSGPGRGRAVVDLTATEIAHVLLATPAPHPNEAAKAANALGSLFPEGPQVGDASLRTSLGDTIANMAVLLQQGSTDFGDTDFELTLCLNPLRATMAWPSRGPGAVRRYFEYRNATTIAQATQRAPPFRRDTVLTQPLLIAVAKLYADTNESADLPARRSAPPAQRKAKQSLDNSDLSAGRFRFQPRSPPQCP